MCRRYVFVLAAIIVLLGVGLAGCNAGDSDAMRAMQANANGTIAALNTTLKTMEATNAAVDEMGNRLEIAQTRIADDQTRIAQLVAQQNGGSAPPPSVPDIPPTVAGDPGTAQTPPPGSVVTPVVTPGGLVIDKVVTAKAIDNANGCAVAEIAAFAPTDARIWAVAYVRNLKSGVTFTSTWNIGGEAKEFTYKSNFSSAKTCINFYIEPKTLNVAAGSYTVSITAPDSVAAQPAQFKVQ